MFAMLYKGIENRQELFSLLKELAVDYRKRTRRHGKAELILIGGSSVLAAYSFRSSTSDVDALISGDSELLEAAHSVAFSHDLAPEWLNDDFKKTDSYTPNIIQYSQYIRTLANCVQIRSVTAGYLVAMKLRSFRSYKHDLSDVIGVVAEEREKGNILTFEAVSKCTQDLYGPQAQLSPDAASFLRNLLAIQDLGPFYKTIVSEEKDAHQKLVELSKSEPRKIKLASKSELQTLLKAPKK
jgi:hypothetical protein